MAEPTHAQLAARREARQSIARADRKLQGQVNAERTKLRKGTSKLKADTGDVRANTRAMTPAEQKRGVTPVAPRPAPVQVKRSGPLAGLQVAVDPAGPLKLARAIGSTVGAIGSAIVDDPGKAASKSFKQATDIAKGLPAAAAVIPYSIAYPLNRAIGNDPGDNPIDMAGRLVGSEVKRVGKTYGGVYKGEKGAYGKLKKQVAEEGPLMPALDVATVLAPASAGLGGAARRCALGETSARATTTRAPVRYSGFGEAREGRVRRSAVGATVGAVHDAARRTAQRAAVGRAKKRGRVRVVETITRKPLSKGSLLHADPKALSTRRANLRPGEVTPLLNTRSKRRLRFEVAEQVTRGETAARLRVKRFVTGKDGFIQATRLAPEDKRDIVAIARQLGIRDAAGARKIIPERLAEIARETAKADEVNARRVVGRAELPGTSTKQAKRDAKAAARDDANESARLQQLLDNPHVFEDPGVQAAVAKTGAITREAIGGREGYGAERLAEGRAGLQGGTLGIKRASEVNAERAAAHKAEHDNAAREVVDAKRDRDKTLATGERVLAGARADLNKARGRAEVLSRNVTGSNTLKGAGRSKYAAGGLGVRHAEEALTKAQARVGEELSKATARVKDARTARAEIARTPLKRESETATEYAARVDAAFKERGLAAPEFTTSKYAEGEGDLQVFNAGSEATPANPGGKTRHGTNYRLGRQGHQMETVARDMRQAIERGARIEAEQEVLARHGLYFADPESAKRFIEGLGLSPDDVAIFHSTCGVVRKDRASEGEIARAKDQGDYISTGGVFVTDKVVHDELVALGKRPTKPGQILSRFAHYPQAALLALSPSWWAFQRVNDLVGAAAGGSLAHTKALNEMRRSLDPESQDIVSMMSGGSISGDFLTPRAGAKLGRVQRVLDENPTYKAALNSDKPATNLLIKAAHDGPTALLRSDARITGRVRERQFLQNLQRVAARMDPDVKVITKGFGPMGHALKTGDVDLMKSLLNDPKWQKARDEAADSLNRVMGDWHNYTATERRLKGAFAFYGFLRYSTRMALYTLPIDHPYVGALVAQLGAMGAEDSKRLIGPDLPYGLGALYNRNGTVAFDLTRANPVTGPLTSITKPEHLFGLGTPLISIMTSTALGQKIGLSDSATGYIKQMTVKGDPNNHNIGGFGSTERLRILGDQVGSLLTPYKEWKRWDSRQQTDDSLPWDRRISHSESGSTQANIIEKNAAAGKGSLRGLASHLLPLPGLSDGRNVGEIGKRATAARVKREQEGQVKAVKRAFSETPRGQLKLSRDVRKVQRERAAAERAPLSRADLEQRRALRLAARGGG